MKSRLLSRIGGCREWALVMDPGDEALGELERFAAREGLQAAHFTGIGAFSGATVAWFDLEAKEYVPIRIRGQVEALSLVGDVSRYNGRPSVHAHLCVAGRDGAARGGHLREAVVRPTLEVILTESPARLAKSFRPEFGIPLIDISPGAAGNSAARRRVKKRS